MSILKRKLRIRPVPDHEPEDRFSVKTEDISVQTQVKLQSYPRPIQNTTNLTIKKEASEEVKAKIEHVPKKEPKSSTSNSMKGTKIVRNYAKALCSFAYSDMAVPYLKEIIKRDFEGTIELEGFRKYIRDKKGKTAS